MPVPAFQSCHRREAVRVPVLQVALREREEERGDSRLSGTRLPGDFPRAVSTYPRRCVPRARVLTVPRGSSLRIITMVCVVLRVSSYRS